MKFVLSWTLRNNRTGPENEADVAGLARDMAIFAPYLDFTVHPVQDIEQAVGVLNEAISFRDSA